MNNLQVSGWLPSFLVPFLTLSYPTAPPAYPDSFHDSRYYATGILDACVIVSCIVVMTVLRDVTRIYLTEPFAKWKLTRDWERSQRKMANGAHKGSAIGSVSNASQKNEEHAPLTMSKKDARGIRQNALKFAEQGWYFLCYTTNFSLGVYVHCNLPTRLLHLADVWLNYPHVPIAGTVKFYCLIQIAFYVHQAFILNTETRRKDHAQMMAHHIFTIILMVVLYACNLTRMGCLGMVLMDCADVVLPFGKMLRYMKLSTLCDISLVVFLVSWFISRHVLAIFIVKSTLVDSVHLVPEMWAPERGNYFSPLVHVALSVLIVSLEVLQLVWFGLICRAAYRVVTGSGVSDDPRSEEEDAGSDEGKEE